MKLEDIKTKKLAIEKNTLIEYIKIIDGSPVYLKDFLNFEIDDEKSIENLAKEWDLQPAIIILEYLKKFPAENINLEFVYPSILEKYSVDSPRQYRFNSKQDILRSIKDYDLMVKSKTDELKKDVKYYDNFMTTISKGVTKVDISEFIQDSKVIQIKADSLDYFELFNDITVDSKIVAIRLNINNEQNYYKIFKGVVISEEISKQLIEPIIKKDPDYATIVIYYYFNDDEYYPTIIEYPTKNSDFMYVNIETSVYDNSTELFIKSKLKDLKIIQEKEKGLSGDLIIKNFDINNAIFLELITNEPDIANFFYVDESGKIYSKKDTSQIKSIYLYYDSTGSNMNPEIDKNIITASFSKKNSGRKGIIINKTNIGMFENYFNIRIRNAPNLESIEDYRSKLSYLFGKYKKEYNKIKKEFQEFIPDFKAEIVSTQTKSKTKLTNIKMLEKNFPEIFITGYARATGNSEKQPIIYDPENPEHEQLIQFNFPIGSENKFVCQKNRYPGLFVNKLSNKDLYKYLPVCNAERTDKTLEEIYDELEEKTDAKIGGDKTVQQKAVWLGKKGLLPKNINVILGNDFFRTGTVRDEKNSFIHAVLLAFDSKYLKQRDKITYVSDFRRNLASKPTNTCSQQLWNLSETQIQDKILDENTIFDSKIFIEYLENYFNCKIFIFSRLEEPNTTFEIPRYNQAYLNNVKNKNIILYKSLGGEGDVLKYPTYELVYDSKNNIKVFKNSDNNTRETVKKLRLYFKKVYSLSILDESLDSPFKFKSEITSQLIDSFGKVRGLNFGTLTMFVSPISNSKPSSDKFVNTDSELKDALSFIQENGLNIVELDLSKNNKIVGILTNAFNYSYIPVIESSIPDSLDSIPVSTNRSIRPKKEDSILEKTKDNKRIADFMLQLALYSFSLQLDSSIKPELKIVINNIDTLNTYYSDQIDLYINKIIVDSKNDFLKNIPRRLTLNSSFFRNSNLIVDSEKTKEKIKWFLHYSISFNSKIVINYKDKKYLDNYYIYSKDFSQNKNEEVFINTSSFEEWLNFKIFENKILETPDPDNIYVQFFWNWRLKTITNNKFVLIQNVENGDLNRALAVSKIYREDGYNPGYYTKPTEILKYTEIYFSGNLLNFVGDSNLYIFKYPSGKYASLLLI